VFTFKIQDGLLVIPEQKQSYGWGQHTLFIPRLTYDANKVCGLLEEKIKEMKTN
jgi:hypothetical protein